MLKKSSKPQSNSFTCIEMMLAGAKKRRAAAFATIRALDSGKQKTNVVIFK